jgi:pantothenate kinase-related protein Tda10
VSGGLRSAWWVAAGQARPVAAWRPWPQAVFSPWARGFGVVGPQGSGKTVLANVILRTRRGGRLSTK